MPHPTNRQEGMVTIPMREYKELAEKISKGENPEKLVGASAIFPPAPSMVEPGKGCIQDGAVCSQASGMA